MPKRNTGYHRIFLALVGLFFVCTDVWAQLGFTENKGQWNDEIRFRYDVPGAIIYLKDGGLSILQYDDKAWAELMEEHHQRRHGLGKFVDQDIRLRYHHYAIDFHQSSVQPVGQDPFPSYSNYFLGDNASNHVGHVRSYRSVWYPGVFPNIDLIFRSDHGNLKYDFVLHQGANPADIDLVYRFVDQLKTDGATLQVKTSITTLIDSIPTAYMETETGKEIIPASFTLTKDNHVGFKLHSSNITSKTVIDPEVVFATYAGNSVDNFGFTATYDTLGHLYAGGIVTSPDKNFNANGFYPTTFGAFDRTFNGGGDVFGNGFPCDIALSKYSADGSQLLYATYLGGQSDEYPHSIVVDHNFELIVFGTTFSTDYPTTTTAFQKDLAGQSDIIITRFSSDGSALVGSTYIGGSARDGLNEEGILNFFYADNFRGEVIVGDDGVIYASSSSRSTDFPTKDAFQQSLKGFQDGVILMMNPNLSTMLWGSYLGGSEGDALYSVDLDSSGKMLVSGGTKSSDLPKATAKFGSSAKGGISDGMIGILNPQTKQLEKMAYWGGNNYDQIFHLELDFENKIYVVGQSLSKMPVIGNVYSEPNSGQFLTKFDADLDNIEWSTVWGSGDGAPDITINAFLVDECRKIFVSGWGGETSRKKTSSTDNLEPTPDAYQPHTDGSDFYLIVFSKQAKERLYATFFGGHSTADHVDGGTSRFDKKGVIYQSVCASCPEDQWTHKISDFPTTKGAYSEDNKSPRCSNASFKIAFGNLNRPPRMADRTFRVTALDTLFEEYFINDPDDDSIFVTLSPDAQLAGKLVNFQAQSKALEVWSQKIGFAPRCEDVGDTLLLDVYAIDQGCPSVKDSSATIRIIVDPPPVIDPPETVCLKFVGDNAIQLTWDPISPNKYFDYTTLYRINPNGTVQALQQFTTTNGLTYTDDQVSSPKTTNYVYYLVVTNLCGEDGPESAKTSTTKEFESPIEATYVTTATVTDNNEILIRWAHSLEEDFGYYDVYKKVNSVKDTFIYLGSTYQLLDTTFTDPDVNVNSTSYCYALVVNDNCGHVSKLSNRGCTIVLDGVSTPFRHDVNWNKYEDWEEGVSHYILSRSVDTGSLMPIATTSFNERNYVDTVFNYDWGGYWYRVTG
ncbi:MAG: hypothetical protein KDC76_13630, partial [Bacteroidetes bacterium]|nr:hypothetical protein [Bacteroidota bacterium]